MPKVSISNRKYSLHLPWRIEALCEGLICPPMLASLCSNLRYPVHPASKRTADTLLNKVLTVFGIVVMERSMGTATNRI